jgi:hypothetical protein
MSWSEQAEEEEERKDASRVESRWQCKREAGLNLALVVGFKLGGRLNDLSV